MASDIDALLEECAALAAEDSVPPGYWVELGEALDKLPEIDDAEFWIEPWL